MGSLLSRCLNSLTRLHCLANKPSPVLLDNEVITTTTNVAGSTVIGVPLALEISATLTKAIVPTIAISTVLQTPHGLWHLRLFTQMEIILSMSAKTLFEQMEKISWLFY